jgi:CRISPR/Cas system-associated exonuclease Cas4 (RecB family)
MIALIDTPVRQAPSPNLPSRVEELRKTVSASRLGLWQQCRLKFYFKYVLQLMKAPTPARHVGSVVHSVLQAWSKARWRKEPFGLPKIKTFLEKTWAEKQRKEPVCWEGEETQQRESAWALLEHYFAETPIPANEKPEAVEVRAEADLASHELPILIGILDLVRAGGRIVDFKTSAQTPNAEYAAHMHETQTSCYAVLYREATDKKESGIELHHLVKTKKPKLVVTYMPPMSETQQTRLFRSIESYVAGVERQDFVPSPGFHCAACEYFRECRLWGKDTHA